VALFQQLELFRGEMIREVTLNAGHANVQLVYWFLHLMRILFYLIQTVIILLQAKIQTHLLVNTEETNHTILTAPTFG